MNLMNLDSRRLTNIDSNKRAFLGTSNVHTNRRPSSRGSEVKIDDLGTSTVIKVDKGKFNSTTSAGFNFGKIKNTSN